MSRSLVKLAGDSSPTASAAQRAADIVAALAPPPSSGLVGEEKPQPASRGLLAMVPGLIGAGVGFAAWGEHRVLGALAGHALATTAMPIVRGGAARKKALCQLGVELAGVGGALYAGKGGSNLAAAGGWAVGIAAGMVATAFVPGSPVNEWWNERK